MLSCIKGLQNYLQHFATTC